MNGPRSVLRPPRLRWPEILTKAADIVLEYDGGVTLRQLFYRLVAAGSLPNRENVYRDLGEATAKARREGRFPRMVDRSRTVDRAESWVSPDDARAEMARRYRRDRTEGQAWLVFVATEKRALGDLLWNWFSELGLPIVALGGVFTQGLSDEIHDLIEADGRPAVVLYGGDFDPSGHGIAENLRQRVSAELVHVALHADQVSHYGLTANSAPQNDRRFEWFREEYGNVQVELDALAPSDLRALYTAALDDYWNAAAFDECVEREARERAEL